MVNPMLAELMSDNGTNRIDRVMKIHKFRINLVRDTTIPVQEYRVFDADSNQNLTEKYQT
jgi:hypothetical protein